MTKNTTYVTKQYFFVNFKLNLRDYNFVELHNVIIYLRQVLKNIICQIIYFTIILSI